VSTVPRSRAELTGLSIADVVTSRGKELVVGDTVGAARRVFENASVRVIPVLDGGCYIGAVDRAAVRSGSSDRVAIGTLVRDILPTCRSGTLALDALDALDASGANRLVVLDDNDGSYRGLVCLRSDRVRLCVDAECHAHFSPTTRGDT
jgi:predicted transcriptional regulator